MLWKSTNEVSRFGFFQPNQHDTRMILHWIVWPVHISLLCTEIVFAKRQPLIYLMRWIINPTRKLMTVLGGWNPSQDVNFKSLGGELWQTRLGSKLISSSNNWTS